MILSLNTWQRMKFVPTFKIDLSAFRIWLISKKSVWIVNTKNFVSQNSYFYLSYCLNKSSVYIILFVDHRSQIWLQLCIRQFGSCSYLFRFLATLNFIWCISHRKLVTDSTKLETCMHFPIFFETVLVYAFPGPCCHRETIYCLMWTQIARNNFVLW